MLFVDQTAQLGGAELCLKDIVTGRQHAADRVVLFQDGPLSSVLRSADVRVSVCELGAGSAAIRKSSGMFRKLASTRDVVQLAQRVASLAGDSDLIYANTPKALVVSAIAGKMARKPVVYHLHDILSADHFSRSNRALLVFLANHFVGQTIANSHATADALISAGGRDDRLTVIYNGIESGHYEKAVDSSNKHRAEIRGEIGLQNEPVVALFGRFSQWKGQKVALQAVRELPEVHLMLVGDALFGEDDYANSIRELAADDSLRGRVHFLGFRNDVASLMQAADVVIHCSTAPEPFGRVIVEAMLSNRPVIATRGGGAMEIIRDGETGTLIEPGSPRDLAVAIREVTGANDNVRAMVKEANQQAKQRFALTDRVADVNSVVLKAATFHSKPPRRKRGPVATGPIPGSLPAPTRSSE